jgi:hypothetical protein
MSDKWITSDQFFSEPGWVTWIFNADPGWAAATAVEADKGAIETPQTAMLPVKRNTRTRR